MRSQIILLAFCCGTLWAQDTGRITGTVTDPSGAAIPKATVNLLLHGGAQPVATTVTNSEGAFALETLRPVYYDLTLDATGFQQYKQENVKVNPSRATDLPPIKLQLAVTLTSVNVTAGTETVQTTSPEISTTVTQEQILRLPVSDRYALSFISTQAGVAPTTFETVINGQRSSFTNLTLDGINIQDNYIRTGALDYTPAQLELDQVQEFTVVTSNQGASSGGGASQVNMTTPSGQNQMHGKAYWQNRNQSLAANDWFNNQDNVHPPRLNLNQIGGSVGGPIKRDRLFFYTNYEAYRFRTETAVDATILTQDARNGIFTYRDTKGVIQKFNILKIVGLPPDPVMQKLLAQVPGPEHINSFRVGDSFPDQLMNTAGYSYQVRDNRDKDNATGKLDYYISSKHSITSSFVWNRDTLDRPDISVNYSNTPPFKNDDARKFASEAWRWNPTPNFTNEVRAGLFFAPATFAYNGTFSPYFIGGTVYSTPDAGAGASVLNQGRNVRTYAAMDNATWIRGRHNLKFGYQMQGVAVRTYDYTGTVPTYNVGTGSANQTGNLLFPSDLPRVTPVDLNNANKLLASLAGLLDNDNVTFNVASQTSGFVQGQPYLRHFTYNNHAFYVQDEWKALRNLTVTAALRWDYYSPVNERDSLQLQPLLVGTARSTMLSDATLYFTGNSIGRPMYRKDLNNFGPNIGLAWDPFRNGKTSIRAGYSISYVNDEAITVAEGFTSENPGLQSFTQDFDLSGTISSRQPIATQPFQVPLKFSDAYAFNPGVAFGLLDPNLRTPYIQMWNFSLQQEVKGTILEARYIGNHATKLVRGFDYNQEDIASNGFLADFIKAQNNGNLALAKTGTFNATYNKTIPGSVPLNVFAKLFQGGLLNNGTVEFLIQNGEPGQLGFLYQVNGINGTLNFYPNPNALVADFVTNYSNSTYDSFQLEVRHRLHNGLDFQVNYVFEKWLSDAAGNDEFRYQPFNDINNAKLDRARVPTDLTHSLKANYSYDLPFGKDHRLQKRLLNRIIGGWMTSGNIGWQSGNPVSIYSGLGTFLSEGNSGTNEANTLYTKPQIQDLIGFRMTGNGPYWVPASAIGKDGRGAPQPGQTPTGQLFTNPGPGQLGALQRRLFTGPNLFSMDAAISKETQINERIKVAMTLEALNVFNHPTFGLLAQGVNTTTFGKITSTAIAPRVLQLDLHVKF
jgi:hypothetical protein